MELSSKVSGRLDFLTEPARKIPVVGEFDLCVVGGSCTGVFAAVRAAQLGLSVALIERNIIFGGMATAAQVNGWFSLFDTTGEKQIIGGLTHEVIERLRRRDAVQDYVRADGPACRFNSAELAHRLDELVLENRIRPFLQTMFAGAVREGGRVVAAIIEDKSGRRAIRARFFIDASGDGDLLRRAGFDAWQEKAIQPVSYQMLAGGLGSAAEAWERWENVKMRAAQFNYPLTNAMQTATPWFIGHPPDDSVLNIFGARLNGVDASDADALSHVIMEARRHQRALLELLHVDNAVIPSAVAHAHALGIRETWHAKCLHKLTGEELLYGASFPDAIARGTYPVDIHSEEGVVLRYLDGRESQAQRDGSVVKRRWRPEGEETPRYYQIPFRSLVPVGADNLLVAGRIIDADREAFGAVRVMVTTNQMGEAAGVAAALSLQKDVSPAKLPPEELRRAMMESGSSLE